MVVVGGVPKISKCIHNTKSSGARESKCATNQKNPLKRERKANGIATETKGDIVAVPNLRARKGADCSGNVL